MKQKQLYTTNIEEAEDYVEKLYKQKDFNLEVTGEKMGQGLAKLIRDNKRRVKNGN